MLFAELIEILDPEPHSAPLNMAIDEVLLRDVTAPTLRMYRWCERAVSFGYFGSLAEAENVAQGRELVRRWTGGGIVEHGEDLTYTLVVPRGHSFLEHSAPESYRLIHEVLARVMAGEGIAAEVLPAAINETSLECFAKPVQYDLVSVGAKIAGAAQRRTRWGLLHQGSIRAPFPMAVVAGRLAGEFGASLRQCCLTRDQQDAGSALVECKYGTSTWLRKR